MVAPGLVAVSFLPPWCLVVYCLFACAVASFRNENGVADNEDRVVVVEAKQRPTLLVALADDTKVRVQVFEFGERRAPSLILSSL
jgi:hypothetical protein